MALALEQAAQHGLRRTLGVHVGRVDVIDPVGARVCHDGGGFVLPGLVAKHHGAQAQGRDLEVALAERAVVHGVVSVFKAPAKVQNKPPS